MNSKKEELINRMNDLKKLIPNTIKAISDLPNIGRLYMTLNPGDLQININYKPDTYLKLRRTLAKKWKYESKHFNKYNGNYYVKFIHRNFEKIKLTLELELPGEFETGATCRLVEVGHTLQIIYGLECK